MAPRAPRGCGVHAPNRRPSGGMVDAAPTRLGTGLRGSGTGAKGPRRRRAGGLAHPTSRFARAGRWTARSTRRPRSCCGAPGTWDRSTWLRLIDSARRCGHLVDAGTVGDLFIRSTGSTHAGQLPRFSATRARNRRGKCSCGVFHRVIDIPVEPQVDLVDDTGRFLGRADLLVGRDQDSSTSTTDTTTASGLSTASTSGAIACSQTRRTCAVDTRSEDLLVHPLAMLAEMDRELGRRHHPSRINRG